MVTALVLRRHGIEKWHWYCVDTAWRNGVGTACTQARYCIDTALEPSLPGPKSKPYINVHASIRYHVDTW
jgi:hypothetical protein